jgi:hypothetical protein
MMPLRRSSPALLAVAIGILATTACREGSTTTGTPTPEIPGLDGFFNPQAGEVWVYAVTRDFAPGSRLRPVEDARATELPDGAKRITFERRRICVGLERPAGAEKALTTFALYEDDRLVEREFYDISSAGLIGRGWTPAPEAGPAVTPAPEGILLTPGVTIALPHMVGGQSWTAPGANNGPLFHLDVIERATVNVPAGEFETARIRLTTGGTKRSTKRTVWFAENVGIVKEEVTHYGPGSILVREELVLTKWAPPSDKDAEPIAEDTLETETDDASDISNPEPGPPSPDDDDDAPATKEATGEPDLTDGVPPGESDEETGEPAKEADAPPADEEPDPPRAEIVEE